MSLKLLRLLGQGTECWTLCFTPSDGESRVSFKPELLAVNIPILLHLPRARMKLATGMWPCGSLKMRRRNSTVPWHKSMKTGAVWGNLSVHLCPLVRWGQVSAAPR